MAVPAGTAIPLVVSNSLVRMPPDLLESLLAGCAASVGLDLHPVSARVAARKADSAMEPRTLLLGMLEPPYFQPLEAQATLQSAASLTHFYTMRCGIGVPCLPCKNYSWAEPLRVGPTAA